MYKIFPLTLNKQLQNKGNKEERKHEVENLDI